MIIVSRSDARANLRHYMDEAKDCDVFVTCTSKNIVVMMSQDRYNDAQAIINGKQPAPHNATHAQLKGIAK